MIELRRDYLDLLLAALCRFEVWRDGGIEEISLYEPVCGFPIMMPNLLISVLGWGMGFWVWDCRSATHGGRCWQAKSCWDYEEHGLDEAIRI